MSLAPIALFVYRRPGHTRECVAALQKNALAAESPLWIFADAPKNPDAAAGVAEVRAYLQTVTGFKSVTLIEQERNQGVANSIINGVTRLVSEYGRVIVVEDDLVVSPHFLEYMNTALDRFASADRVLQVSGYMVPVPLRIPADALFLPFTTTWGWATWQRAWAHFDPLMTGYARVQQDRRLRRAFNLHGAYNYFRMLEAQRRGEIDSWAIRWYLSVFLQNGLVLYPVQNLVQHRGCDGSSTHSKKKNYWNNEFSETFQVVSFPSRIERSELTDTLLSSMKKAIFRQKIKGKLHEFVKKIAG